MHLSVACDDPNQRQPSRRRPQSKTARPAQAAVPAITKAATTMNTTMKGFQTEIIRSSNRYFEEVFYLEVRLGFPSECGRTPCPGRPRWCRAVSRLRRAQTKPTNTTLRMDPPQEPPDNWADMASMRSAGSAAVPEPCWAALPRARGGDAGGAGETESKSADSDAALCYRETPGLGSAPVQLIECVLCRRRTPAPRGRDVPRSTRQGAAPAKAVSKQREQLPGRVRRPPSPAPWPPACGMRCIR